MIMLRGSRGERFDVTTFPRRGWYSALEDANLAIDCERVGDWPEMLNFIYLIVVSSWRNFFFCSNTRRIHLKFSFVGFEEDRIG